MTLYVTSIVEYVEYVDARKSRKIIQDSVKNVEYLENKENGKERGFNRICRKCIVEYVFIKVLKM